MKPNSHSPSIANFFKVMIQDFQTKLELPPIISRKLVEEMVEKVTLISCKGCWKVKVVQRKKDGLACLENGWSSFVNEHGLKMGDFAVFKHVGDLDFKVTMFDRSTCEKDFCVDRQNRETNDSGPTCYRQIRSNKRGRPSKEFLSDEQNTRQFWKKIKQYNVNPAHPIMYLPLHFVKANRIDCNTRVILRGPCRKSVTMEVGLHGKRNLYFARSGWYEFYTSNKIKKGDDCLFQLKHNHRGSNAAMVLDVQVFPAPA